MRWNAFIQKKGGLLNSLPPIRASSREKEVRQPSTELFPGKAIVFVTGGPRSGKKTQCDRLAERYGLTHISVEQLIETLAEETGESTTTVRSSSGSPRPVSQEELLTRLQAVMEEKASQSRAFLLSGAPHLLDRGKGEQESEVIGSFFRSDDRPLPCLDLLGCS